MPIQFSGQFHGPISGTEDTYLFKVSLTGHQPLEISAEDSMEEIYPMQISARPLHDSPEESHEAFIQIKCPKLKAIRMTVQDSEDNLVHITSQMIPETPSESFDIPQTIHAEYDLTPEDPQTESVTHPPYRIQPGRRTQSLL